MPIERDRSSELNNIFFAKRAHHPANRLKEPLHSSNDVQTFSKCAQAFSHNIAEVSNIILRLTELSSRQSVFEDQTTEISGLTQMVKVSLQKLHKDLDVLENLKSAAITAQCHSKSVSSLSSRSSSGKSAERHSNTMVESLKSKLARTGQDFRFALQQQTKNMKNNSIRRNLFSSADQPQSLQHALSNDIAQYQQQQVLVSDNSSVQYNRQRLEDVMQMEAAVTEVNELFSDFSRVVREQEDFVVRIDTNVSEALLNVNAGSNELLRYLSHLTSNRGLIVKLLGFLFLFLLFFGLLVVRHKKGKKIPLKVCGLMSKLLSSQELVLHQVNVERVSNAYRNGSSPNHAVSGSSAATAAILTPEIHDRPEWYSSLQEVPMYSLPTYVSMPIECALTAEVHYVADKFDRHFLAAKAAQNSLFLAKAPEDPTRKAYGVPEDSDLWNFEDLITSFELEGYKQCAFSSNKPFFIGSNLDDFFVREIFFYWLGKKKALGGQIPCIPSVWVKVTEENQSTLCRSQVLGDCPIPFKSRDWGSAIIVRQSTSIPRVLRRKRKREFSFSSIKQLCKRALYLSMQVFIREQLQYQHTCSSLYELSYLRNFPVSLVGGDETRWTENLEEDIPFETAFGLPFLPSMS